MAARTLPSAAPQAADGQLIVGVDDSPGGPAGLRAADGPPPGPPVTIETPEANPGHALTRMAQAGDNVIVAGTTSGHHLKRAMHGSVARYCATHAACPVVIVPGGRSRRVGG
jgi:nucleotide-binding universal stress UspA family protein